MSQLISNLKYLRTSKELTQQQMAAKLGIPRPTYSGWERASAEPSLSSLRQICEIFGVSLDNLVYDNLESDKKEISVNENFRVLAISVDADDRQMVEFVPQRAEAGYVQSFSDPEFIKELPKIQIPGIPEGTYRAFEINGESMLPMESGSIVIGSYIERLQDIKAGKTYVIATQDGIVYKRLRKSVGENYFIAVSDNSVFPPFELQFEEIREIWQYHCHIAFNDHVDMNAIDLQMQLNKLQEQVQIIHELIRE
jgi:transcriptional regulator with XRE-family HTH domain